MCNGRGGEVERGQVGQGTSDVVLATARVECRDRATEPVKNLQIVTLLPKKVKLLQNFYGLRKYLAQNKVGVEGGDVGAKHHTFF